MSRLRCKFPYCEVTKKEYPTMRFIRFPHKHEHRFAKWVQIIGDMDLLLLPESQISRQSVCARHFRDECFQSYQRRGFIAPSKCVPTLLRLNDRLAFDFEHAKTGVGPTLIRLRQSQLPHMIPPLEFKLPYTLHDDLPDDFVPPKLEYFINSTESEASARQERKRNCSPATDGTVSKSAKVTNASDTDIVSINLTDDNEDDSSCVTINLTNKNDDDLSIVLKQAARTVDDDQHEAIPTSKSFLIDPGNNSKTSDGRLNCVLEQSDRPMEDTIATSTTLSVWGSEDMFNMGDDVLTQSIRSIRDGHHSITATAVALSDLEDNSNLSDDSLRFIEEQAVEGENENLKIDEDEKCITRKQHENMIRYFQKQLRAISREHKIAEDRMLQRIQQLETHLEQAQEEILLETERFLTTDSKLNNMTKMHKLASDKCSKLRSELIAYQKPPTLLLHNENNELRKKCDDMKSVLAKVPQMVDTAAQTTNDPQTKRQLFEDVQKYVSPSLASLIRIEMFCSKEKVWETDERRAAADLLQLGENVYKYLSHDWDIQLPPLRMVRKWLKEVDPDADREFQKI